MLKVLSGKPGPRSRSLRQDDYRAKTNVLATISENQAEDVFLRSFSTLFPTWQDKTGRGIVPKRSALRFQDFVGWHARMVLADLPEDGNLRFRIAGDRVMDMFGHRIRPGDSFSSLPSVTFDDYAEYFKAIRAGDVYGRYSGMIPFEGRNLGNFEVLDLPAADEEGNVAFLFSFFLYR
ncbi:PAS domain-containing protein [Kordiimonas aestuarii]|uniref:PAS domain-containing protein n=1 Tax=Kordiimonas aestuarii TaxID=1005925 RepID=UPI0021CE5C53|nr:PAS domain-containing protein [Kordiimonas aestuarii]